MSSLALALLLSASTPAPLSGDGLQGFDLATLGREAPRDPLAAERDFAGLAPAPCPTPVPGEIVVCGRHPSPSRQQRLPMPDQRFEPGEVVRYPGEPPSASADEGHSCARPGSCEPSRLMNTLVDAVSTLFYAIKGEDKPVPPIP